MNGGQIADQLGGEFTGLADEELQEFKAWLSSANFLPPEFRQALDRTQELIGAAGSIVGSVATVVGILDAVVKIAEVLLVGSGRDRIDQLAEEIQQVEQLAYSTLKWTMDAGSAQLLGRLDPPYRVLAEFLAPSIAAPGARQGLLTDDERTRLETEVLTPLREVLADLLPSDPSEVPAYEQRAYVPTVSPDALADFPEGEYEVRIDPTMFGINDLPMQDVQPPAEWLGGLPAGTVWDYRRSLLHILRALTLLVTAFKLIDPAYRVTGRFRSELDDITKRLKIFAARWMQCISWTRDLPLSNEYPDSDFPEVQAPAAYESRSMVWVSRATEFPPPTVFQSVPLEPVYSQRRLEYAQKVLAFSGFNAFYDWIGRFASLAAPAVVDESLGSTSDILGVRRFERLAQVGPRRRTVKVYHVDWDVKYHLNFQPQLSPYDYASGSDLPRLPIEYAFFLESYEQAAFAGDDPQGRVARLALEPGTNQRLTLTVFSPDVYVPTEDDGSFGDGKQHPRPDYTYPGPGSGDGIRISDLLKNLAAAGPKLTHGFPNEPGAPIPMDTADVPEHDKPARAVENSELTKLSTVGHFLTGHDITDAPPPKAEYLNGQKLDATIGCSFDFGPSGNVAEGLASFHAWNLEGETTNVGALYLTIEATPKLGDQKTLTTRLLVPINPTEYWYAAYSRIGPHFVPA